jgi:hypothetical protein
LQEQPGRPSDESPAEEIRTGPVAKRTLEVSVDDELNWRSVYSQLATEGVGAEWVLFFGPGREYLLSATPQQLWGDFSDSQGSTIGVRRDRTVWLALGTFPELAAVTVEGATYGQRGEASLVEPGRVVAYIQARARSLDAGGVRRASLPLRITIQGSEDEGRIRSDFVRACLRIIRDLERSGLVVRRIDLDD